MEICDLDIEYYKFDKKLGKYETKLNAGNLELGAVKFITDERGNYLIKFYSKQEAIKKYYKTYFNIDTQINNSPKKMLVFDKSLVPLVENYLMGLFYC
jgi:hypothetical protein